MPLAPVMIVSLTIVLVMILTAIKRNHNLIATASVIGLNLGSIQYHFANVGWAVQTCERDGHVYG
jgi:NADH-quinone oxidoreductase subunit N